MNNLLDLYKQKFYSELYKLFQQELKKISIEFNLDYQELEDLYLSDFKNVLK
tara:strand:- start:209 stop:364 length:156 start_codon:yes stop_codon:yes gene_type:complete